MAPEASAPTVAVSELLAEKRPLAPAAGALNVTGTPAAPVTAQPSLLKSATCRSPAKAVSSVVVWGVPATSVSWLGGLGDGQFDVPVGEDCVAPGALPSSLPSPEANAGVPPIAPAHVPRPARRISPSTARWRVGRVVLCSIIARALRLWRRLVWAGSRARALLGVPPCRRRSGRRAPGPDGAGGRRGRDRG